MTNFSIYLISFLLIKQVSFTAPEDMAAPVYVYYQLDNFYQNHRRYVKSLDKNQMLGMVESKTAHKECLPLVYNGSTMLHPCGLVANSLFNGKQRVCLTRVLCAPKCCLSRD